jgi:hypothetical protein
VVFKKVHFIFATSFLFLGLLSPVTMTQASKSESNDIPKGRCAKISGRHGLYRNRLQIFPNKSLTIGKSVEGRRIWAEHWGSVDGPQVLVVGQVHGNECTPGFLVNEFRRNSSQNFGYWIIPTLNPDGLARHSRRNANNVDLNRDGVIQRATETRTLLAFTKKHRPILTIHLHSPSGWIGHFNGGLSREICLRVSKRSNMQCRGAGRSKESNSAFLWEGQAKEIPGHQSVLIEMPRVSPREAPSTPKQWVVEKNKRDALKISRQIGIAMRRALSQLLPQDGPHR